MLEAGHMLQNRYRIVELLGGGGMGQVYLAEDTRLADKLCALKELNPDPHTTAEEQTLASEQFQREAAILAHLNHPNLPNVYDYFEETGHFYLVMDYIEGETISDRLAKSPQGLPPAQVTEWAIQLCNVLEYLHNQSPPVIFRDLKPSNIMLTPNEEIQLIDFGVARLFDPGKSTDTLKMGTAGYAPPEQYAGQGQTTPQSDIYALGATLYELLTGDDPTAHPFVFTPPHKLKPSIPQSLSNAIMRAVSLDPKARFPTAGAMRTALEKATRPRRFTLPTIQRQKGTGTTVLPEAATARGIARRRDRPRSGVARVLIGITKFLFSLTIAASILSIIVLLGATFALSKIVEVTFASIDWGLTVDAATTFTMHEDELSEATAEFLELYALDAVQDVSADFHAPDEVAIHLRLFEQPITLEAQLEEEDGVPRVLLKQLNDTPMYIVGGILSSGINRGFQKSWEESPWRTKSIYTTFNTLFVELEPNR